MLPFLLRPVHTWIIDFNLICKGVLGSEKKVPQCAIAISSEKAFLEEGSPGLLESSPACSCFPVRVDPFSSPSSGTTGVISDLVALLKNNVHFPVVCRMKLELSMTL